MRIAKMEVKVPDRPCPQYHLDWAKRINADARLKLEKPPPDGRAADRLLFLACLAAQRVCLDSYHAMRDLARQARIEGEIVIWRTEK